MRIKNGAGMLRAGSGKHSGGHTQKHRQRSERTGQINPRGERRGRKRGVHCKDGRHSPRRGRMVPATCVTVERVGWSAGGGGEGGDLGQEVEGRGGGDLAVGAEVLSGDAGDNGVFHGNRTFRSGRGHDE